MIKAHIIPSNNLKPKSKVVLNINSIPINPNKNPAAVEITNWRTAISCLLICLTENIKIVILYLLYYDMVYSTKTNSLHKNVLKLVLKIKYGTKSFLPMQLNLRDIFWNGTKPKLFTEVN